MSIEELERAVQVLMDRQAIHDCLMNYSRAVDRLDADLIRSCYHEDAIDDHGVFVGDREQFIEWVIPMHTNTHLTHQHAIMNYTCDLDGDVAHTEAYYMFIGLNREGKPLAWSGGRYLDRFEKRDGRWAIAARVCIRDWAPLEEIPETLDQSAMTVVKGLSEEIKALMRTGPQPSRDRNDPSYDRPLTIDPSRVPAG